MPCPRCEANAYKLRMMGKRVGGGYLIYDPASLLGKTFGYGGEWGVGIVWYSMVLYCIVIEFEPFQELYYIFYAKICVGVDFLQEMSATSLPD